MRARGLGGLLAAAVVLAGCTSTVAGSALPGDPASESSQPSESESSESESDSPAEPSGDELIDALLPESELPPEDYELLTDTGGAGVVDPSLVTPPECRRVIELNNLSVTGTEEFASRAAVLDRGLVSVGLARGELVDLDDLRDAIEACPQYTVGQGATAVTSDQQVLPAPGTDADMELQYMAVVAVNGVPTFEGISVLLRDGDEQVTVNVPTRYADQAAPLATAQLERKRDVLD